LIRRAGATSAKGVDTVDTLSMARHAMADSTIKLVSVIADRIAATLRPDESLA